MTAQGDFSGTNGEPMTLKEIRAVQALARLSKRWPQTLKLVSMGGALHVIHTADERFHATSARERAEAVLYTFENIPSDGGDW